MTKRETEGHVCEGAKKSTLTTQSMNKGMKKTYSQHPTTTMTTIPPEFKQQIHELPAEIIQRDQTRAFAADSQEIRRCLSDATQFFNNILSDPKTEHTVLTEWNLDEETGKDIIEAQQLGYAENRNDLVDHLIDSGYHPLTIVQSGLTNAPVLDHLFFCHGVSPDVGFNVEETLVDHYCPHTTPAEVDTLKLGLIYDYLDLTDIDYKALFTHLYEADSLTIYNNWDDRITVPYLDERGQVSNIGAVATSDTRAIDNGIEDATSKYAKQITVKETDEGIALSPPGVAVDTDTDIRISNNTPSDVHVTVEYTPDDEWWADRTVSDEIEFPCGSFGYYTFTVETVTGEVAKGGVICTDSFRSSYRYTKLEEWLCDEPAYQMEIDTTVTAFSDKPWIASDTMTRFYGVDSTEQDESLIVTEDLRDAVGMRSIGLQCVAFASTALGTEDFEELGDIAESVSNIFLINETTPDAINRTLKEASIIKNMGNQVHVTDLRINNENVETPWEAATTLGYEDGFYEPLTKSVEPYHHDAYDTDRHELTVDDITAGNPLKEAESYKTPLPDDHIAEHYHNIQDIIETLAEIEPERRTWESYPTMAVFDHSGWYITEDASVRSPPEGVNISEYRIKSRPIHPIEDYNSVLSGISRTLYTLTSYKSPRAISEWTPAKRDNGSMDYPDQCGKPAPDISDIRGWSVWGDFDLADELKPLRANLPDDHQQVAEQILERYITKMGNRFFGTTDPMYALDSIGGAYIMSAPAITLPIAQYFLTHESEEDPEDALERVFKHFNEESNQILREIKQEVNQEIQGADNIIDPDIVNNPNRQYKAPGSIHSKHPGIVTPLDTEDPSYEFTHVSEFGEELHSTLLEWAEGYTDISHTQYVESLVATLWADAYESANEDWRLTLDQWVQNERKREKEQEQARQKALENDIQETEGSNGPINITASYTDVEKAIQRVSRNHLSEIVRKYACDEWDTDEHTDDHKIAFDPSWRHSESGQSCFVNTQENIFGDSGESEGGYATHAIALGSTDINYSSPDQTLSGQQWYEAVGKLRNLGYDIPHWIPGDGSIKPSSSGDTDTYDKTPNRKLVEAALVFGLCEDEDLVEKESKFSPDTYETVPEDVYDQTIIILEEEYGIDTGRNLITDNAPSP